MRYKAFISYSHAADARLAPALRSALRRIGMPWYRRARFSIFLDESSLSANPALWDSIEAALSESEYLILLASTSSSRSEWVRRELEWWFSHRDPATVLILITEGDVEWRPGDGDFNWERTTALSPQLRGRFREEPLWVDLRWARTEPNFSLRHTRFRSAVLQIAPALYGVSREDLDDEDVRHYRSARRLAVAATCVLLGLVLGITAALRTARQQRSVAGCRELAGQAIANLDTHFDLALLLAAESSLQSSCIEGRSALLTALQHRPRLLGFLHGHSETITSVAYAPGGKIVASSSWDRTVRLWDVLKRRPLGPVLKGMYGISFRPDGTLLASADGSSISLWTIPTGTPAGELEFDKRYSMSRVAFSPDGRVLAASNDPTGTVPSEVFLWDARTWQLIGPTFHAGIFAFSPDGKILATEGEDGKGIVLHDIRTRRQLRPPLKGHTGRVRSIAFSADGRMLAAGAEDNSVIVWDIHDRLAASKALIGHRAPVNAVVFNPEADILASGSGDGSVILWDLERFQPIGLPLTVAEKPIFDLAFSPDGRTLVSNSEERVVVWNIFNNSVLGHELEIPGQKNSGLVFSPEGKTLASINTYGEVTLSDAETGRILHDSLGAKVTSVAFSPDGALMASVGRDGRFALWDPATGEPKGPAEETGFRLFSVTFSPDGRTIAVGGDSVLMRWDTTERHWVKPILEQKDRIWSVAFSPDGKLLASGGNSTVGLWDSQGSPVIAPLNTDPNARYLLQTNVAFSRDGRVLAYRQGDTGVVLWDVAHRRQLGRTLPGNRKIVTALAFSPDGQTIATGRAGGMVVLWDLASRQQIGPPFTGVGREVESLAFRPNGKALAALGDRRLLVWDVQESSWRETACKLANRNLTRDEWSRFFGPATAYRKTCVSQSSTQK